MASAKKADYYDVLGVAKTADAAELKRVYRELAMRWHPDKNPGDKSAEERFKQVSEAYAVLSDSEQRARYDRVGHGDFDFNIPSVTELFESVIGDLFGRKKDKKQPGRDLRYTLEIDFVEAALGCDKTITFPSRADCGDCQGTGAKGGPAGQSTCGACGGRGEIKVQQGFFSVGKPCGTCSGVGKVINERCAACKGSGAVDKERQYTVTIAPGTESGAVRRVAGQGESGRRGGSAGDLAVLVEVKPHPLFKREGNMIVVDVPLTIAQAALGCTIKVPTLDGKVDMRVPPGTQTGTIFRLKGKGIPVGPKGSPRGDARVRVTVETPVELSAEQRALVEKLAAALEGKAHPAQEKFLAAMKDPQK